MQCSKCKTQWNPGYFNNLLCPQCHRKQYLPGLGRFIKFLFLSALLLAILAGALYGLNHDRLDRHPEQIPGFIERLLAFPNLFAQGPEGYLDSLAMETAGFYRLNSGQAAYQTVLSRDQLASTPPDRVLPAGVAFQLRGVRRLGEIVWLTAETHDGDALQQWRLPLPQDWQARLEPFNYHEARARLQLRHDQALSKTLEFKRVESGRKADNFARRHPDYFPDASDGRHTLFFKVTDRARREAIKAYLNQPEADARELLQLQPDYRRPPFRFDTPNPNQGADHD